MSEAPECGSRFSTGHPGRPGASSAQSEVHGGHSHGLGGHATATGKHRKKLIAVLAITLGVCVVQLVGALLSQSLALLADAGHMLTDATGIAIALIASLIATLPANSRRTYGYLRI